MPPNAREPFDRERMTHRVRALTAGTAVLATAATVGLAIIIAGPQADADTTVTGSDPVGEASVAPGTAANSVPSMTAAPRAGSSGSGSRITSPSTTKPSTTAPSSTAPRQQLTPVAPPTQARGRTHSGSGGS